MKRLAVFACALCAAFALASSAFAQVINLEADYWMPFNGDGKAETGYMLDIAKAVFGSKGLEVKYTVTPWARALEDVRAGRSSAVIAAGVDDAPDFVFPVQEQGIGVQSFYVKAGSSWKYSGVDSLKNLKLGVIKDYTYYPELDAYIKANPSHIVTAFGEEPLKDNLRLLLGGGVDVVIDSTAVLAYTVGKLGMNGKVVSVGTGGAPLKMYIAFSPANPKSKEYVKILSDGMDSLRKSGKLKAILAKYGLADWK